MKTPNCFDAPQSAWAGVMGWRTPWEAAIRRPDPRRVPAGPHRPSGAAVRRSAARSAPQCCRCAPAEDAGLLLELLELFAGVVAVRGGGAAAVVKVVVPSTVGFLAALLLLFFFLPSPSPLSSFSRAPAGPARASAVRCACLAPT